MEWNLQLCCVECSTNKGLSDIQKKAVTLSLKRIVLSTNFSLSLHTPFSYPELLSQFFDAQCPWKWGCTFLWSLGISFVLWWVVSHFPEEPADLQLHCLLMSHLDNHHTANCEFCTNFCYEICKLTGVPFYAHDFSPNTHTNCQWMVLVVIFGSFVHEDRIMECET